MAKIKQLEIKPPKLYRNWNENTISWDDAFRNYNESVVQSHLGEESLKQKGSGYMVSHRAEKLPEVKGAIRKYDSMIQSHKLSEKNKRRQRKIVKHQHDEALRKALSQLAS